MAGLARGVDSTGDGDAQRVTGRETTSVYAYYFKLAAKSLKRNKALTALMILTIAVGIGAAMTTLTVYRLLSADPLPHKSARIFYPQIDSQPEPPRKKGRHPLDMLDYRSAMDLWQAKRAARQTIVNSSPVKVQGEDGHSSMLSMVATTSDFFPMFDVPLRYGKGWSANEDATRARVAVISGDLNRKLFGGADSTGKTFRVRGQGVRVIGVLGDWRPSPRFYNLAGGNFAEGKTASLYDKPEDMFMPLSAAIEVNDGNFQQFTCSEIPKVPGHLIDSDCVWLQVWIEVANAAQAASYREFLANYATEQKAAGRIGAADNTRMFDLNGWLDYNHAVPSDVGLQMWLALAFLLLCLFNTIGLLLAKFMRRSGEYGVRRALGATRNDIVHQCLAEAGLVGLMGGGLGFAFVLFGLWRVRQQPLEYASMMRLDTSMFLLLFAMAVAVSLLAGWIPAMRASRVAPAIQLKTQ